LRFLTGTEWNPVTEKFQALPFVAGTLITSFLALIIATILSLALAVLMGEYFKRGVFATIMRTAVELLAGIPSVVYGFIGLFFLSPVIRLLQEAVGAPPYGVGILTASILLAFMILPYSASIGREMISLVPRRPEGGSPITGRHPIGNDLEGDPSLRALGDTGRNSSVSGKGNG
jgi:phosphate transport system permease protein